MRNWLRKSRRTSGFIEAYKGTDPYIFVSYAHKDSDKVFPIISEFHKAGFLIWYDEGIDPGNEWPEEIGNVLDKCSLFIVFISDASAASVNVRNEINFVLKEDKHFIAIWLEEAKLTPGLKLQIGSKQAIMHFRMEPENFYRKCQQSFEAFGIKRTKARVEAEKPRPVETRTGVDNKAVPAEGGSAKFFYDRAFRYQVKHDYDKAIADYTEAIRIEPSNAKYFSGRASCHESKNDHNKAIADATEAIRIEPSADNFHERAVFYFRKKDYDKAIADATEAIRIKPSDENFCGRGFVYYEKGDYDKAIADYTEAIRINPSTAFYFSYRGDCYRNKKDYDKAIADYTEAVRLKPGNDDYKKQLETVKRTAG
jgi:tetratricopeptide (TPR) repeat protein